MQVHGVKKDEIQLQIASGQMQIERADSNHSEAKYDPGMLVESRADQGGHETGLLSIRPGQQHEMLVRQEDQVMTTQNKFVKFNWLAEREHFRKSTSSNQTELNHTKPNSSIPN